MAKAVKNNVLRHLERCGVVHTPYSYDISDGNIDAVSVANKIGRNPEEVFKTLVTRSAGPKYYVFIIPGCCELDLKKAARAAGEKNIVMIKQKELLPLTGYIHGGCSPIGMKKQFPTFTDATAKNFETILFSAGRIGYQVEITLEELRKVLKFELVDITV